MGYTMARLTIGDVYECTEETSNTIQASMTAAGMLQKYNYTRWQDMLIQDFVDAMIETMAYYMTLASKNPFN